MLNFNKKKYVSFDNLKSFNGLLQSSLKEKLDDYKSEVDTNVQKKFNELSGKVQTDSEVIDARKGEASLRAKIDVIDEDIKNVSSQLEHIENTRVDYKVLEWEKDNVINKKLPYGDIRRYGAKCDGVTCDSDVLQWCLDNCSPNGVTIYIPENEKILITKSLILKNNYSQVWYYKIKSNHMGIDNFGISQKCKNLFVGENFYNDSPQFTQVKISIIGLGIKANGNVKQCTVFKALQIFSSRIENCLFYNHYTVLEGCLGYGTKFIKNRVQGFDYAVISSISIIDEDKDFNYIDSILKNSNYDIDVLSNLLVVNNSNLSDYSRYSSQSNDAFFKDNYIAGAQSLNYLPQSVFSVESIDSDFIVENNWFEFCKYVISPLLRVKGYTTSSIIGTYFNQNVFQNFHRFFNPHSNYTSFTLNNNLFYNFSKKAIKEKFKNVIDLDVENTKSGVIVSDINEEYKPAQSKITLNNNYFETNDYSIFLDSGNDGKYIAFTIKERDSLFNNDANKPYIQVKNTDDLLKIELNCFNKSETTLPVCNNNSCVNSFVGRQIFVNSELYICIWNGSKCEYKKINLQ